MSCFSSVRNLRVEPVVRPNSVTGLTDKWNQLLQIRPGRIINVVSLNNRERDNSNDDIIYSPQRKKEPLDLVSVDSSRQHVERASTGTLRIKDSTEKPTSSTAVNIPQLLPDNATQDEKDIYYDKIDSINNTAIFFIHGVGGSSDVWTQQLHYFRHLGYGVICPDMIGHGFSPAMKQPKDYTFSEICEDLLVLFDRFHRQINFVIGHSYG